MKPTTHQVTRVEPRTLLSSNRTTSSRNSRDRPPPALKIKRRKPPHTRKPSRQPLPHHRLHAPRHLRKRTELPIHEHLTIHTAENHRRRLPHTPTTPPHLLRHSPHFPQRLRIHTPQAQQCRDLVVQVLHQQRREAVKHVPQCEAAVLVGQGARDVGLEEAQAGQEGVVAGDAGAHGAGLVEEFFECWEEIGVLDLVVVVEEGAPDAAEV